jgi:hypothetical protein
MNKSCSLARSALTRSLHSRIYMHMREPPPRAAGMRKVPDTVQHRSKCAVQRSSRRCSGGGFMSSASSDSNSAACPHHASQAKHSKPPLLLFSEASSQHAHPSTLQQHLRFHIRNTTARRLHCWRRAHMSLPHAAAPCALNPSSVKASLSTAAFTCSAQSRDIRAHAHAALTS